VTISVKNTAFSAGSQYILLKQLPFMVQHLLE